MPSLFAWLRARRASRRTREERLVIDVLRRTPDLSGWPLAQASGLGAGQIYVVLARLERDGRVVSRWQDGPYPRRRLYRLAENDT